MSQMSIGAVLGYGRIGKIHFSSIDTNIANAKVKYVVDEFIKPEDKKALQDKGVIVLADAKAVFADPEVHFVVICTPTNTHKTYIEEAIKSKKHIFCEKPLDADLKKVKEIVHLLDSNKHIKMQIGLNRRWDHNFKAIKDRIDSKKLGDLYLVNVTSFDPDLPPIEYLKVSGGLFTDMTIHDFDMMRYLTSDEVEEVYAAGTVVVNPDVASVPDIDAAIINLKFKKHGQLGVILNSRRAVYGYDQRAEVLGSLGAVTTDNDRANMAIWKTAEGITHEKPLLFFLERYMQSYISEMQYFVNHLWDNTQLHPDANDGYQAMRIAEACNQSLKTNRPVRLDDIA